MHALFGTKHLILIALSFLAAALLFLLTRKWKFSTVCKNMFYLGIVSEFIKVVYYITANEETYGGVLPKSDLPFHLCSIQILFFAVINFTSNEKIKRVLYSFMLPSCLFGGIAAILIATDSSRNGLWILTLQYFAYHAALIVFSLHLFTSKELRLNVKDYFNCLKFLVAVFFFAVYINGMLYDGTRELNFMYVVSPPQPGLPYLNEDKGWLVYMIRYAVLVVVCVTLCYLKPIWKAIKEKKAARS
ncbi:MAG: hypothetical protein E7223_05915 [Clostridiales bacterium]|nr:hypothetical protein [Clostridiales bacterium]